MEEKVVNSYGIWSLTTFGHKQVHKKWFISDGNYINWPFNVLLDI